MRSLVSRTLLTACFACLVVVPRAAAAAPPTDPPTTVQSEWYGYETFALDAAAIALFGGGLAIGRHARALGFGTALIGDITYLAGAPIVHLSRGEDERAGVSFGLRLGAPMVGALAGASIMGSSARGHGIPLRLMLGIAAGSAVGAAAASLVDGLVLARRDVFVPTEGAPMPAPSTGTGMHGLSLQFGRHAGHSAWHVY